MPYRRVENSYKLAESLREPNTLYFSPNRIGELLGLQSQALALRAHVSPNVPLDHPDNEILQRYLQDVVRVLITARFAAGGNLERAISWFFNEPIKDFANSTADELVQDGKTQTVISFIESACAGSSG